MRRTAFLTALLCLGLLSADRPASAHHSPAMFDRSKTFTVIGTVRQFQWTNPHSYIQLVVAGEDGSEQEWSFEMAAVIYLYERGWRRNSLQAGDRIEITASPLRRGGNGGLVIDVQRLDGKPLGTVR